MTLGRLTTLAAVIVVVALAALLFVRQLLAPWLLASLILLANLGLSLLFMQAIRRLKAAAAAGVAVLSFLVRFGLIALGLLVVALALPDYLLSTAICFLAVYTVSLGLEIFVNLKAKTVASSAGGEA